jgi:hypothetical protein
MTNVDNLARWQAAMDMAIYKFEKRTGLTLAGLPPAEITKRINEWARANKSPERLVHKLQDTGHHARLVRFDSGTWNAELAE